MKNNSDKVILLVEGEAIIALDTKAMLEQNGYSVICVYSGDDAIVEVKNNAHIDFIIIDVNLGQGMDGITVAQKIQAKNNLPLMFLSSYSDREMVEKIESVSSYGFLPKQSGSRALIIALNMAIHLHEIRTQEKERERALQKSNRFLIMLSECNQILMKTNDEQEVLEQICKVVVTRGEYVMAWVGIAEHDNAKTVRPIASYGSDTGYLLSAKISWADNAWGRGPTGIAIRTGRPYAAKEILHDPSFFLWREEALKRGYASSIALPMGKSGKIMGALNVYASETDRFDDEEIKLLSQLADNIAYGFTSLQTDKKQETTKRKLQESENKFKAIFETSSDALMLLDAKEFFDCNQKTLEIFNLNSKADFVGMHPAELSPPSQPDGRDSMAAAQEKMATAFELGSNRFKWIHCTADGKDFPTEVLLTAFEYQGEKVLQAAVRDISEDVKIAEELVKKTQQAQEADKLKSAFLSTMSHEIRTPLNAILGFTDLTLKACVNKKHLENLQRIKSSGTLLLKIINDILDLSKIEAGQFDIINKPFSLLKLFDNLAALTNVLIKQQSKDILFRRSIDEKLADYISGDFYRLEESLLNLLNNSIKFTDKGSIELTATLKGNKRIEFVVRDTGKGISKDKQKVIFKPFIQEDASSTRKYGGTGLGLTITKNIIELMDGTISLRAITGENHGTTVIVELPYTPASEPASKRKKPFLRKSINKTILVVEDNAMNQLLVKMMLEKSVYKIIMADNGQKAVELYSTRSDIDLILMDVQMPVKGGLEATVEIRDIEKKRNTNHSLPIIMLSAAAMQDDKEKGFAAGCNDYLTKPIEQTELIQKLEYYFSE